MADTTWPELGGKQIRTGDGTWEFSGEVDVRDSGNVLAVEATRVDEAKRPTARLYFDVENPPDSLNPGALGEHFDRVEWEGNDPRLVVKTTGRTYRYEFNRLAYD
ncbi:hypothetical protein [Halobacterium litoreum]|uniref:Uncharacterized protein n=1 Tax=Halobacterium litoreum TaxID=2039234 RepID=A0ABD5NBQ1_9EURY|nr:hypothetical protein [Halobacterium litoreum]UHH14555.1 hypothetical protein LT972_06030 [Halobacterium litoreum]